MIPHLYLPQHISTWLLYTYHPRMSCWLLPAPNKHEPWICWKLMWINPTSLIVPCLLSWVSELDDSYEYLLAWNFSLPLTSIPALLGDENKLLVLVGSSWRREYVIPYCQTDWNIRSTGYSLAKRTKHLSLVPIGKPENIPVKTKWAQIYKQVEAVAL